MLAAAKATGLNKDVLLNKADQPAAIQLADEWKGLIDVAKIQGIPGYVVNGRYLVMTKAIRGVDYFHLNQDILLIPGMLFSRGSQW